MGLGEIEKLLHAVPDPHAEGAARTEGDQGLDDLKTGMAGVFPGIEKGHEAGQSVALVEEEPGGHGNEQGDDPREVEDPAAGQIDHHQGDDGDDDGRAEIGLQQDQSHQDPRDAEGDEQSLSDLPDAVDLLGQEIGQKEDQGNLDHLGDLEREDSEVEPADGPAGADSQMGDPERAEAERRDRDSRPGQLPELVVGNPGHQDHDQKAEDEEKELFLEKELPVAEPLRGEDGAGAVDHHRPDGHQKQGDQQEDQIRFLFPPQTFHCSNRLTV